MADLVPDDEEERLFALEIEGSKFSTKKQFWSSKKDKTYLASARMFDLLREQVTVKSYENGVLYETHEVSFTNKNVAFSILNDIHSGGFGDVFNIVSIIRRFKEVHGCKNVFIHTHKMNDFFNSIIEDDLTFITITPHIKRYEDNLYLTDNNEVISDIDYHFTTGLEHGSNTIRRIHYSQRWLDLLGISDYQRLKPTLKEIPDIEEDIPKPYICFSEYASMVSKHWHYENGWQELVDYFVSKGYTMVPISYENSNLSNIFDLSGDSYSHLHRLSTLKNSEFFIGLDSGLSCMANFIDKYCFLIVGSVEEEFSFQDHVTRIGLSSDDYCRGCLEDVNILRSYEIQAGCFYRKDFECTRLLSSEMVINIIEGTQL